MRARSFGCHKGHFLLGLLDLLGLLGVRGRIHRGDTPDASPIEPWSSRDFPQTWKRWSRKDLKNLIQTKLTANASLTERGGNCSSASRQVALPNKMAEPTMPDWWKR